MARRITNWPNSAALALAVTAFVCGLALLTHAGCGILGDFAALLAATGGGGGAPATEMCANAIDDDGDGLTDCEDTDCSENGDCTTPTGACCVVGNCMPEVSESDCHAMSGAYKGDDSICDPDACGLVTVGACCMEAAGCFVGPEEECDPGSIYLGDGTDCDPDPCSP